MKGKNVKRGLATLLLASMAAGTLAGCGQKADTAGSTSADADSDGKTKIVLLLKGYLGDLAWYVWFCCRNQCNSGKIWG